MEDVLYIYIYICIMIYAGGVDLNPFTLEPNRKFLGYILDRLAEGADLQVDERGAALVGGGRQVRFHTGGVRTANGISEYCRHEALCDLTFPGGYNANTRLAVHLQFVSRGIVQGYLSSGTCSVVHQRSWFWLQTFSRLSSKRVWIQQRGKRHTIGIAPDDSYLPRCGSKLWTIQKTSFVLNSPWHADGGWV